MPKIVYVMILGGLALGVAVAVNFHNFNTHEETRFIQISVLAENHANYGVDENLGTVPAVSIEILEDKFHDAQSSVPIIRYTSLPAKKQKSEGQGNDYVQPADKGKVHDNHGNNGNGNSNQQGGGNPDQGNSGNAGSNQNTSNGGANSGTGANSDSGNSSTNNDKGDENKPDKNTGQKNETNNGPQPDANPNKTE